MGSKSGKPKKRSLPEAAQPPEILTTQIVALFDLLGFSAIANSNDSAAQAKILMVLQDMASRKGNFAIDGEVEVIPAVSVFSDHIIISFDIDRLEKLQVGSSTLFCLRYMIGLAGFLSSQARKLDCLIRGAITVGSLFHKDGVIFGPALIRAHKMESEIAFYPRIIVDSLACSVGRVSPAAFPNLLYRDPDGWDCLDYFNNEARFVKRSIANEWAQSVKIDALERARAFEIRDRQRAAQNWAYFAGRFEASIKDMGWLWTTMYGKPCPFGES